MNKMKRFFQYVIIFILIIFVLPAVLTRNKNVNTFAETKIQENEKNPDESEIKDNKKIKLLHTSTNQVEEVLLEEYICNVVSAEMPVDYEIEALKAQAIVARTYTMYKIKHPKHDNADICPDAREACVDVKDERHSFQIRDLFPGIL